MNEHDKIGINKHLNLSYSVIALKISANPRDIFNQKDADIFVNSNES